MELSMVCPRGEEGGGASHGKFDIFSFQMSICPPLGLHFESNSHPWGELTGSHDSLYCSTACLQRVFFSWWQNNGTIIITIITRIFIQDNLSVLIKRTVIKRVSTNFVLFHKCRRHILARYFAWLNTHAMLQKVPLNCFTQCLQQCKMCNARTWHAVVKKGLCLM